MNFFPVGSRADQTTCSFTVWAPLKQKVELVLEGANTVFPMIRNAEGYWMTTLEDITPGTRYRFRLDGDKALPDPASRAQPDGVHGASATVSLDYEWRDHEWRGLPLDQMIIYELHVGTFSPTHDFEGVVARLPYLSELGINAIELMPVAQFPGERNWGYDGVFPFAPQHSYGGRHGLKTLVDEAHRAGIAVILDVVYNHQGPEGNYLGEYAPYFTDKFRTGWGSAINFDDAWCDGVRNFYRENALMWLDEFHIDGLRLDAVHAIWDFSAKHFLEELSEAAASLEKRSGRKKVLIAELDLNSPRYIKPAEKGGYGLQGQWIDEFHHAMHSLLTGEVNGYYEDFGSIEHLVRALRDAYVYTGQYSRHRKRHFGRMPMGTSPGQFVVFAQNHDQIGNRMLGDRLSSQLSPGALKLAAATYLLSPYVPMLFMGEEYGERKPFQYFVSHEDKDLVAAVRNGRKEEFATFQWQGEVPDPQSEETFERCVLTRLPADDADARELLSTYQFLIRFRKERRAMHMEDDARAEVTSSEELICLEREHKGDQVLILLYFGKTAFSYGLGRSGRFRIIYNSALPGGSAFEITLLSNGSVDLKPQSVLIIESY